MFNDYLYSLDDYKELHQYLCSVPYEVVRKKLYDGFDLFDMFDPDEPDTFNQCYDTRVYRHVVSTGKMAENERENIARALHDTCISNAMNAFLARYDKRQVVGIMGGHAMKRTDEAYRQTVMIAKQLAEHGFLIISGGGPGAMEASHLGAWLADRSESEVNDALSILGAAPSFSSPGWLATAFEVVSRYPRSQYESLAIPTWYYGHEPPTIFATHIAKYFTNSIREDVLLTAAYGGLIYMPGSAGTLQEIFQEAVQDHYESFGFASPMVFVGRKFWSEEVPVWPFMQDMMARGKYKNLILDLCDTTQEIVDAIERFYNDKPKTNK